MAITLLQGPEYSVTSLQQREAGLLLTQEGPSVTLGPAPGDSVRSPGLGHSCQGSLWTAGPCVSGNLPATSAFVVSQGSFAGHKEAFAQRRLPWALGAGVTVG